MNETRATDARRLSQVEQPLGPMMRFNPMGPEGGGVSRYRPLWMPLAEVIVYIAELITGGDLAAAREEFLTATRERALDVYAKRSLFAKDRILIPREDWWNCQYLELPDSMASGFFFGPHERWYDLEIRRSEVEALWPRPLEPSDGAPTLLSPGPKGGERRPRLRLPSDRIGSNMHLRHVPIGDNEDRPPIWAYAHASLKDGQAFEVLPYARVLKMRAGSQGYRTAMQAKARLDQGTGWAGDQRTYETAPHWCAWLCARAYRLRDQLPFA